MAVADWVYLTDTATGCSYYANLQTRETSWHRPAELDDPAAVAAAGSSSDAPAADAAAAPAEPTFVKMENGWFRYTDDASGRFYYYNKNTQKTKWSVPADALPAGDAGYASSKSIGGDDDVDAPEENVYVRRLSGARLDSVENVGEAAAPEAQLSEEEAAAEKARKKAEKRAVRRAILGAQFLGARNSSARAIRGARLTRRARRRRRTGSRRSRRSSRRRRRTSRRSRRSRRCTSTRCGWWRRPGRRRARAIPCTRRSILGRNSRAPAQSRAIR